MAKSQYPTFQDTGLVSTGAPSDGVVDGLRTGAGGLRVLTWEMGTCTTVASSVAFCVPANTHTSSVPRSSATAGVSKNSSPASESAAASGAATTLSNRTPATQDGAGKS